MGRVSMPIMNKTGYSMYWNCMWDDKSNYSRSLKDDIFLKIFFYMFFEGDSNFMIFLNLKELEKKNKHFKKRYNFQIKKVVKDVESEGKQKTKYIIKKKNSFKPYLSKIWILKFQTWVIIYFYSYLFDLSFFFKKKKKESKKFKKYIYILLNYYNNLIKYKYNYKLYKKIPKSKYF